MLLRTQQNFSLKEPEKFKQNLFDWAQQFEIFTWLDSNNYPQKYSSFDCVLAAEEFTAIQTNYHNAFNSLKEYQTHTNDFIFGYLGYDLKNDTEQLTSTNFDSLHFADLYFFQPKKIIFIKENTVEFHYLKMVDDQIESDFELIKNFTETISKHNKSNLTIQARIHKKEYLKKVNKILKHINRGDIYEANFCQEFYAENAEINPYQIYKHLNKISKPPFACFFKNEEKFLLSATPERYLRKEGTKIISQPIKGTAKRLPNNAEDNKIAINLAKDEKERAENIMIVDLVRNDLSKSAKKGTVKVDELCKVYSFKQVHQLISTISCQVKKEKHPVDIIKETFPMGSMTGAPKISAMQIIETLEETKRGLYSGALGYFTPNNDFDFNVVIRSILYNQEKKYISYSVGGAITAKSNPEKEYTECLLKAEAMKHVLQNN